MQNYNPYRTQFMMRIATVAAFLTCVMQYAGAQAADGPILNTDTHRFQEIAPGVYFAVGTGTVFVQSNSMVIVNQDDVVVVDSHVTADAARALIDSIASLTDKPIRVLINTHYHFDHAHGNQSFPANIQLIGHEFTRHKLLGNVLEEATYRSFTDGVPEQLAELRRQRTAAQSDRAREAITNRLKSMERHHAALGEVRPTPPNITLDRKMTLYHGAREIQILFFGRGHTGGDVVVFLPEEKVVFTGDLLLPFLSYMGDAYADEWDETLDSLRQLDFDIILPGHGGPIRDKKHVGYFQAYLRDFWSQAVAFRDQGVPPETAAERIDLTAHQIHFRQITGPGADLRGLRRVYELLEVRGH